MADSSKQQESARNRELLEQLVKSLLEQEKNRLATNDDARKAVPKEHLDYSKLLEQLVNKRTQERQFVKALEVVNTMAEKNGIVKCVKEDCMKETVAKLLKPAVETSCAFGPRITTTKNYVDEKVKKPAVLHKSQSREECTGGLGSLETNLFGMEQKLYNANAKVTSNVLEMMRQRWNGNEEKTFTYGEEATGIGLRAAATKSSFLRGQTQTPAITRQEQIYKKDVGGLGKYEENLYRTDQTFQRRSVDPGQTNELLEEMLQRPKRLSPPPPSSKSSSTIPEGWSPVRAGQLPVSSAPRRYIDNDTLHPWSSVSHAADRYNVPPSFPANYFSPNDPSFIPPKRDEDSSWPVERAVGNWSDVNVANDPRQFELSASRRLASPPSSRGNQQIPDQPILLQYDNQQEDSVLWYPRDQKHNDDFVDSAQWSAANWEQRDRRFSREHSDSSSSFQEGPHPLMSLSPIDPFGANSGFVNSNQYRWKGSCGNNKRTFTRSRSRSRSLSPDPLHHYDDSKPRTRNQVNRRMNCPVVTSVHKAAIKPKVATLATNDLRLKLATNRGRGLPPNDLRRKLGVKRNDGNDVVCDPEAVMDDYEMIHCYDRGGHDQQMERAVGADFGDRQPEQYGRQQRTWKHKRTRPMGVQKSPRYGETMVVTVPNDGTY